MLLRVNQLSWEYFMDAWNVFDYSLVVFSCADLVVSMAKENGSGLRWAASMRIFRAFRIARALKGEKIVVGLFRITQGFIDALPSVFWMSMAAFIFAYMLAVVLTSLVGGDTAARELWLDVDLYCGTVSQSLYTILQIMTMDSVHEPILRPILSYAPLGLIVVYLTMLILSFGTLNILLAIMVERMTIISQDTQESKVAMIAKSEKMLMVSMLKEFDDCDADFNGELDLKEFRKVLRTGPMTEKLKFLEVGAVEAENLFEMMDVDKSGALSPMEFLSGLFKVKGQAKGADLCRLITILEKNKKMSKAWVERMRHMNQQADLIQARLNQVGRILAGELKGLTEAANRAEHTWSSAAKRKLVIQENELKDKAIFPGMIDIESDDGTDLFQL
ncbi:Scn10a [Symbiodinium natans]|uniref:Scn10a protein n=1 Tax=Symbiodinium natans TaxID=878477 RepID=A0A812SDC7_9DINO|nr:Scn10a [Symbiodinium natans]